MGMLETQLLQYGVPPGSSINFSGIHNHRLLRYADLTRNQKAPLLDLIVEQQSRALLYIVDESRSRKGKADIQQLRRILAMRDDGGWLGVLKPGQMDIYATDLRPSLDAKPVRFMATDPQAVSVLPRLAQGENLATPSKLHLRKILFDLMANAVEALTETGLPHQVAIALCGRALFLRYLVDRQIVNAEEHLTKIAPGVESWQECMADAKSLAATNLWLDNTFNGDLLLLPAKNYQSWFTQLLNRPDGNLLTQTLSAILLLDTSDGPGHYQGNLDWGELKFDHLPADLLGEIYEELMYRFYPSAQQNISINYTPRNIVDYMIEETFHELPEGSKARVLDPACGAGIFLTASFRKLVELRYQETGKRPSRPDIRRILHKQLVGMDINSHARSLAALSLYLTALELDPHPSPIDDLRFEKLNGSVLLDVKDPNSPDELTPMAGSLGDHVFDGHRSSYDVVIGNPPWTSLKGKDAAAIDKTFTKRCQEVAANRELEDKTGDYANPDRVPDLPFVWGAMHWAKPDGRIALAVAGRWLFKQSEPGIAARKALFQALKFTKILNGTSLRKTNVWPKMSQPFCLVFADNKVPESWQDFWYINPYHDPDLNSKGILRIDPRDSVPVPFIKVLEYDTFLKTMYRGTSLDVDIVNLIKKNAPETIGDYWNRYSNNLVKGSGYKGPGGRNDDTFLEGLPDLPADYDRHPYLVQANRLDPYNPKGLDRPRNPLLYKAPLLLIRESLREDRNRGRALISEEDIAFARSYYGYSAAEHIDGDILIKYLLVVIHSRLFEHYALMTSGMFGFERDIIQGLDIEHFPFIPPESLSAKHHKFIEGLAEGLKNNKPDWSKLDSTVADIYGLTDFDQQRIADVVAVEMPYASSRDRGLEPVNQDELVNFILVLKKYLGNAFRRAGRKMQIQFLETQNKELPWQFFSVAVDNSKLPTNLPGNWMSQIDTMGVSQLNIVDNDNGTLTIGLLNQYRYWVPSRAVLLAGYILWNHGAILEKDKDDTQD